MFSPVSQLQNLWSLARMLAHVGDELKAPGAPRAPQGQGGQTAPRTGGVAAPPGDSFQPSKHGAFKGLNGALANHPKAQEALQQLQDHGKLDAKAKGGTTLAQQLDRLRGQPQLLAQVVKDLAHPGHMRQGQNNDFCAQTDALSQMARRDPGNYARVAADLALKGSAEVKNGVTLRAQKDLDPSKMSSMSATQKLMAPALAEYANGAGMEIDSRGVSHATDGRKANRTVNGTYSTGMERMQQALIGSDWDSQYIDDSKKGHQHSVASAERTIHDNLKAGENPAISRDGHWYNVTGFRATPDGGRMTVTDPLTGESKTVNARHFLDKAEAVTFDRTDTRRPEAALMAQPKHEKPGGGGRTSSSSNPVED